MDMRAGMNILCTIRVSKNYSKNKHKTQSNQRHRFTLQIPNFLFSKKKKIPIPDHSKHYLKPRFSSPHREPSPTNPKPSGILWTWTHEIHGGGDADDEFSCSSLSLFAFSCHCWIWGFFCVFMSFITSSTSSHYFDFFALVAPCDSLFNVSVTLVAIDKTYFSKIQYLRLKVMTSNVQAVFLERLLSESFSVQNPEKKMKKNFRDTRFPDES